LRDTPEFIYRKLMPIIMAGIAGYVTAVIITGCEEQGLFALLWARELPMPPFAPRLILERRCF
jgi:hypothetical protein